MQYNKEEEVNINNLIGQKVNNPVLLQIVPLVTLNSTNKIEFQTNAILYIGSDTTLIPLDTADKLNSQGTNSTLNIANAVAT